MSCYIPERSNFSRVMSTSLEPVTLNFVQEQTLLADVDDSVMVESYIKQARELVEGYTNRTLMPATATLKISEFPKHSDQWLELPGGKVRSVTSIAYTDTNGDSQTFTDYVLEADDEFIPARVGLVLDGQWPLAKAQGLPITITYECGWADAASVPESLKGVVAMLAASLYDNRFSHNEGQVAVSLLWQAMVGKWRIHRRMA